MNNFDRNNNGSGYNNDTRFDRSGMYGYYGTNNYGANNVNNYAGSDNVYNGNVNFGRPDHLNDQNDPGGSLLTGLQELAIRQLENRVRKEKDMQRRQEELMKNLPYNGAGTRWTNEDHPYMKRAKMLWTIASVIVYGMFALGLLCFLFQKRTSTYHGMDNVSVMFLLLFPVIGIAAYSFVMRSTFKEMKNCTVELKALLLSYSVKHSRDAEGGSTTSYVPTYGFNYNGQNYSVLGHSLSNKPKVGEEITVFIDPDDPNRLYRPGKEIGTIVGMLFFCTMFIGMPFFMILFTK